MAEHSRACWNDDAVVREDWVGEHRFDRLTDALDDHATIERHAQRRSLFHDESKRYVAGLSRRG